MELKDLIRAWQLEQPEGDMSDTVYATGSESKYRTHPEGQFIGQCVDVIDMGEKVEEYAGKEPSIFHKCVIVFRTDERNEDTGEHIDVAREFTVSMGDKANLRKFLEQWRGKPYNAAEVKEKVPLHKLTGQWSLLTIAHKVSKGGRTYANITAAVGVPKQLQSSLPEFDKYVRPDFYEKRKAEYAEAVRAFKGDAATQSGPPAPLDDDDDLPF